MTSPNEINTNGYRSALRQILSMGSQQYFLDVFDEPDISIDHFLNENIAQSPTLSASALHSRDLLAEIIAQRTLAPVREILGGLLVCPAIFTGPHCSLFVSLPTFVSRCLAIRAAAKRASPFALTYECSTVSLQSKNGVGPGWMEFKGTRHNVFGVPRQIRDSTAVCARHGIWRFNSLLGSPHGEVRDMAARIASVQTTSPEEAIQQANDILCGTETAGGQPGLLSLADNQTAGLVARHLTVGSVLSACVLDQNLRECLLEELETHRARFPQLLPSSTELFWIISEGRRHPAKVADGRLQNSHMNFSLTLQRDELVANLRAGRIVPNLLLTFMALCILPDLACFGGHRQMIYIELFKAALGAALKRTRRFQETVGGKSVWLPDGLQPSCHPLSLLVAAPSPLALSINLLGTKFPRDLLPRTRLDYIDPHWYAAVTSNASQQ